MTTVDRSFSMSGEPAAAQAAFRRELEPSLKRAGFRLDQERPGHLRYGVGYTLGERPFWLLLTGWLTTVSWLARLALGRRIEVAFHETAGKTRVELFGRTGAGLAHAIGLLGRAGHWPNSADDPDWMIEADEDPLAEWDEMEHIDLSAEDRITRRALKRSGRLS